MSGSRLALLTGGGEKTKGPSGGSVKGFFRKIVFSADLTGKLLALGRVLGQHPASGMTSKRNPS
jgi:hypothetical protein